MLTNDMSNLFPKIGTNIRHEVQNIPILITTIPRKMYTIRNFTPGSTLFVGYSPEVDNISGFPVLAGEVVYLNTAADLYILSDLDGVDKCDARIMINS